MQQSATIRKPNQGVWLTWERHRRTTELAEALSIPVVLYSDSLPRLVKYVLNSFKTTVFLLRARPQVVVVQNPSIVQAWLTALLKSLLGYHLILDNHNDGVRPFSSALLKLRCFSVLYSALHRRADLNIVTNTALAATIEAAGGKAFVLPDKLPRLPREFGARAFSWPHDAPYKLLFICTYAADEPVAQVIAAARLIQNTGVHVFLTGAPPKNWSSLYGPLPPNCHMLGFLAEEEFIECLYTCDAIMDLTAMEDCLVCGAYEAVATGKPLLTSDTAALREYFHKGTLYTRHTPQELAMQMSELRRKHETLVPEMREFKKTLEHEWQDTFSHFQDYFLSLKTRA